jgi:hypothetical protein
LVGTFLRVRTQRATAYEDNHKLQRKKAANCSSRSPTTQEGGWASSRQSMLSASAT